MSAAASGRRCPPPPNMRAWRGSRSPSRVSRPVVTFSVERLMDTAAAALGIDPVELRRRNLIRSFPYVSATGLVFDEATYAGTLEQAVEAADLPGFRARQAEARE